MALRVDGGSLSSFLTNLSWKSCRSDMCVSVNPFQLSQLWSSAGITYASNSLVADIGVSDTSMISSPFPTNPLVLAFIVSVMLSIQYTSLFMYHIISP